MTPYGLRSRKLPAPPPVVWDDLVRPRSAGTRAWLDLVDDEVAPTILESERPHRVVWSSLWPSRPDDRIVLDLTSRGTETLLTFTLLTPGELPDASKSGHLRKRINQLLFASLRYSYGQ